MVNFASIAEHVEQAAASALRHVHPAEPLAKVADEAAAEVAKKPSLVKKAAIGAAAIGGVGVLSTGVLGRSCEKIMGANHCDIVKMPEDAIHRLLGLPMLLAEGVVYVAAGAFVIGSTLLAHNVVGNGWLTAGTFTVASFVAVGIVNRED